MSRKPDTAPRFTLCPCGCRNVNSHGIVLQPGRLPGARGYSWICPACSCAWYPGCSLNPTAHNLPKEKP